MTLTEAELERYSRQLVLPDWSGAAQRRLAEAQVVLIGAGALGAPVGAYLVGAGVGRLEMVDFDVVELSNLHRQVLYSTEDLGRPKAEVAATRLAALNPSVVVAGRVERVHERNVRDLVADASLVVDCSDSFETRYSVNDACCGTGVALVEAGVLGFEGLVLSMRPGESACYRCAFPTPPPTGSVPTCREGGVLGPMAGIVGAIQALEALKLLAGVAEPLLDRILQVDGRDMGQTLVRVRRRADCPACAPVRTAAQSA